MMNVTQELGLGANSNDLPTNSQNHAANGGSIASLDHFIPRRRYQAERITHT